MNIKFFKKEKNFKKKDFELNPNPYWELSIGVIFVVVIALAFLGYRLFVQINQEYDLSSGEGNGLPSKDVDEDRVEKVLNYFSERKEKSNQILNSRAPVVDPSL